MIELLNELNALLTINFITVNAVLRTMCSHCAHLNECADHADEPSSDAKLATVDEGGQAEVCI